MKAVFDSVESKVSVLKKAKNLREKEEGGQSKVFIHQDLTPKQREARKPLVAELKQRKANGEKDVTIFISSVKKKIQVKAAGELLCFYINARKLLNKFDDFEAWIHDIDPDIVGVT